MIDQKGLIVFDKPVLCKDGEIPAVFRTGLLKNETLSNMSDLMNEIEHESNQDARPAAEREGETSMDS